MSRDCYLLLILIIKFKCLIFDHPPQTESSPAEPVDLQNKTILVLLYFSAKISLLMLIHSEQCWDEDDHQVMAKCLKLDDFYNFEEKEACDKQSQWLNFDLDWSKLLSDNIVLCSL